MIWVLVCLRRRSMGLAGVVTIQSEPAFKLGNPLRQYRLLHHERLMLSKQRNDQFIFTRSRE